MKKLLTLFLAAMMILSALPVGAETYNGELCYMNSGEVPLYKSAGPESDVLGKYVDVDAFEAYVTQQLKSYAAEIDVTQFNIPYNDEVADVLAKYFVLQVPEAFHIGNSLPFAYTSSSIVRFVPNYIYSEEDYRSVAALCETAAEEMLDGIKGNDALSDAEKALLIHDRLALACEYDYENVLNNTVPYSSYNMNGVFLYGTAVCEGYAEAYDYLLSKVGIDGYICSSDALDHAWNIIEIDGELYHVDVTWDDPVWDIFGQVMHENFLRSSAGIYSTGHEASDYDTSPADTSYDNFFWQDYNASFQLVGGEIYYIDAESAELKRYSDGEVLASVGDKWTVEGSMYFSGLARLASDGTDLFYSLSDGVYIYDISEGASRLLVAPDFDYYGEYYAIYGMTYADGYIYFDLNNYAGRHETAVRVKWEYVPAVTLESVTVAALPEKTAYYIGDAFDADGLTLTLTYSDGSTETVSTGFEISGFSSATAGNKTVTVTYGGKSATFQVAVQTPVVTVSRKPVSLAVGDQVILTAYTTPNALPVTWSSTDTSVVTVSADGTVTAVGEGTADIIATLTYNGIAYRDSSTFTSTCTHKDTTAHSAAASTCTVQGHGAYTVCNTCGDTVSGSNALLPLAPHTGGSPSCVKQAVCTVCGTSYGETDPAVHGGTELRGAVEATADTDGYTGDTHCADCGTKLADGEIIPATGSELPTGITSDVFEITGGSIYIPLGTSVKAALEGINESSFVTVLADGEAADGESAVATGMTVAVMDGGTVAVSLKIVVRGDVNRDGEADFKDVSVMIRYGAGWYDGQDPLPIDLDAAELTDDGEFSARDMAYLIRYLAGWAGYTL